MTVVTRLRFRPRIERDNEMVTVFCDEFGLAASSETQEIALDRLRQAVVSYCHALQRKDLLERVLDDLKIAWESVTVETAPGEMLVDVL